MYIENPKTKGSGVICAIPQRGRCPNNCEDCFFQSGRSYLEPLEDNLPNMPDPETLGHRVVRVNDGNDSSEFQEYVMASTSQYPMKFYNTASPDTLDKFDAPVVLTINPGALTDATFYKIDAPPENLMFVRFRINRWNVNLAMEVIEFYGDREIPIVLTFMAYFKKSIPEDFQNYYTFRKRTLNSYWAITTWAWRQIMNIWAYTPYEKWVYSCGKIEGEGGTTACRHCGNCLREYFATMERMAGRGV